MKDQEIQITFGKRATDTKVYLDGNDVSRNVSKVLVEAIAGERWTKITLELIMPGGEEIAMEGTFTPKPQE